MLPSSEYLRGLNEAMKIAYSKSTAPGSAVAVEIKRIIDAEERRLAAAAREQMMALRTLMS